MKWCLIWIMMSFTSFTKKLFEGLLFFFFHKRIIYSFLTCSGIYYYNEIWHCTQCSICIRSWSLEIIKRIIKHDTSPKVVYFKTSYHIRVIHLLKFERYSWLSPFLSFANPTSTPCKNEKQPNYSGLLRMDWFVENNHCHEILYKLFENVSEFCFIF